MKGYAGEVTREPISEAKTLTFDRLLTCEGWNISIFDGGIIMIIIIMIRWYNFGIRVE